MSKRIFITAPDGRLVSLVQWAAENGRPYSSVSGRYYRGVRDPMLLIQPGELSSEHWTRKKVGVDTAAPMACPILSEQKRAELRELAKYSMGQPEQKYMLCDFVPCRHEYADYIMEALGL